MIENTHLICYADAQMQTSQQLCMKSAIEKGDIELAFAYGPDDIDSEFSARNAKILQQDQRGGGKGHWLWKPYICEQGVRFANYGDYVIYADSGVEFISSISPLIEIMTNNNLEVLLFGNNNRHIQWTKKECMQEMASAFRNRTDVSDAEQVQASVIIIKVSPFTEKFTREWLAWSEMPGMIDDGCDLQNQHKDFIGHRNDQSILTNLAIKYDIPLHWWPVQYGHSLKNKYRNNGYGQLFLHHRYRENDWASIGLTLEHFMLLPKR